MYLDLNVDGANERLRNILVQKDTHTDNVFSCDKKFNKKCVKAEGTNVSILLPKYCFGTQLNFNFRLSKFF